MTGEAAEQALLAVERELAVLFRRGRARSVELSRRVHPQLEGVGYSMLGCIEEAGQLRVTDIGAHFGIGKATVSRQVKALEELGLVRREQDPLDGRSVLVSLTQEGRERYLRTRAARMTRIRARLETWEEADVLTFSDLLHRFNDLMNDASLD